LLLWLGKILELRVAGQCFLLLIGRQILVLAQPFANMVLLVLLLALGLLLALALLLLLLLLLPVVWMSLSEAGERRRRNECHQGQRYGARIGSEIHFRFPLALSHVRCRFLGQRLTTAGCASLRLIYSAPKGAPIAALCGVPEGTS